jgi:hypothetical protein
VTAAPLKLVLCCCLFLSCCSLRGHVTAAPLKRGRHAQILRHAQVTPRSRDRGPIEAYTKMSPRQRDGFVRLIQSLWLEKLGTDAR